VKRYGNRKLYDTQESRYVTLEDISGFVKAGEDLRVVDNDSGEDLTAVTFAQIILDEERKKHGLLPLPILRKTIQPGEETLQDLARRLDKGMEAIGSIGEKAGKRVSEFVGRGATPGKALLDDIVTTSQKRLESLQKEIDDRVKKSVDRITSLPAVKAVQKEIARIEKSIERVEQRLSELRRTGAEKSDSERRPPE
jgi:polyhydroxyalkanoate synthesis repressor PhaR